MQSTINYEFTTADVLFSTHFSQRWMFDVRDKHCFNHCTRWVEWARRLPLLRVRRNPQVKSFSAPLVGDICHVQDGRQRWEILRTAVPWCESITVWRNQCQQPLWLSGEANVQLPSTSASSCAGSRNRRRWWQTIKASKHQFRKWRAVTDVVSMSFYSLRPTVTAADLRHLSQREWSCLPAEDLATKMNSLHENLAFGSDN